MLASTVIIFVVIIIIMIAVLFSIMDAKTYHSAWYTVGVQEYLLKLFIQIHAENGVSGRDPETSLGQALPSSPDP